MDDIVKIIKCMPVTFEELQKLVKVNMESNKEAFMMKYENSDKEIITIKDDDDLHHAYGFAQNSTNGILKL